MTDIIPDFEEFFTEYRNRKGYKINRKKQKIFYEKQYILSEKPLRLSVPIPSIVQILPMAGKPHIYFQFIYTFEMDKYPDFPLASYCYKIKTNRPVTSQLKRTGYFKNDVDDILLQIIQD